MTKMSRPLVLQAAPALIALFIGTAVYLLDRQPETVYLMADWMGGGKRESPFFGTLGGYLPAFIHVYAFILLTVLVAAPSRVHALAICLFWLVLDSAFELAQVGVIARAIADHVPGWFAGIPFLDNTSHYFLAGTFDVLDLYAIAAGSFAAYLTIVISNRGNHEND